MVVSAAAIYIEMGLVEVTNRIVTTCSSYFKLAVIETRVGNPLTKYKTNF